MQENVLSPEPEAEVASIDAPPGRIAAQLRIAVVAPPWFTVPPTAYGGIERIVSLLADGLARQGHRVTLFAPRGSRSQATIVETFDRPMYQSLGDPIVETANALRAYRHWDRFDVVHDHTNGGLACAPFLSTPVVHTVHGPVTPQAYELYESLPSNAHLVSISADQKRRLPPQVGSTLIHNFLEPATVPWSSKAGDYVLFIGRAAPSKGPLEAIRIARKASVPLRMFLKVNEPAEHEYLQELLPHIRAADVELEMETNEEEKQRAYAGAMATLFPISWDEPFGLVMIESMAAGTPVIAFPRGAAPEVIADGETGFLCHDVEDAVRAVSRLGELSREACRRRVERLFSAEAGVAAHEALYASLVRSGAR